MSEINTIWIGDELKLPDYHTSWGNVKIHGNDVLGSRKWELRDKMKHYASVGEINGVADCLRWELLWEYGGIFVDADSERLRTLPDFIKELPAVAAWENEVERPGLIACGFLKFEKKDPFIRAIIDHIKAADIKGRPAWEVVGPGVITEVFNKLGPKHLTILPSHFFYPVHYSGLRYEGTYMLAAQHWSSTRGNYGT
jgi:mannosyltransferase OCH1-like enzyme